MNDRYPYLRFLVDASQAIAGAVAAIVLLGGTLQSCGHGFFGGLLHLLATVGIAGIAYVVVMAKLELVRLLLDVESSTRQLRAESRTLAPPPPVPPTA